MRKRTCKLVACLLVGAMFCPSVHIDAMAAYSVEASGLYGSYQSEKHEYTAPAKAVASAKSYTVTFDGNGAESGSVSDRKFVYGKKKALPANAFYKKGYTFKNWNTESDGTGNAYKNKASVKNLTKEDGGIVTLYAQWKANKYTVVFNGKGKTSGVMANMSRLKYDQTYTLPANTYSKNGCTFLCWNTKSDGTGTDYEDGAEIENLSAGNGATVTLYAKWDEEPFSITYELDGGENNAQNPDTYTVSSSISLKRPLKFGYTFNGWYTTADFKKKVAGITKGSYGEKTFYAKWTPTRYKITYKLNGGKNDKRNPSNYTYLSPAVDLEDPTKKGYEFGGWYSEAGYQNALMQIPEGSAGDVVLYAKWDPIIYTVSFDAGGATGKLPEIKECKYGKSYSVPWPNLVRKGYTFKGWYANSSGKGTGYLPGRTIKNLTSKNGKNVTLYAVWTPMSSAEKNNAEKVVSIVNSNRRKYGKDDLIVSSKLSAIAQERAYEIAVLFDHKRPDGTLCYELIKAAGYAYLTAGENIAFGYSTPQEVMNGWMNSTGHRANILNGNFKEIGVGCYSVNGRTYWVQCFGTPYNK